MAPTKTPISLLCRDYTARLGFLHELKDVCGNAALTMLYEAVCPLVELLRPGDAPETETTLLFCRAREGIAPGGGLCVWGGINLLEGYGQNNPVVNAHG